jgi:hypothetical protein
MFVARGGGLGKSAVMRSCATAKFNRVLDPPDLVLDVFLVRDTLQRHALHEPLDASGIHLISRLPEYAKPSSRY